MKKLLYITDQQEYADHGSIGPIFNKYLSEMLEVKIVFFTKFKSDFQDKKSHYVLPDAQKRDVLGSLEQHGVDIASFDYVFVRNMEYVLKDVLLDKSKYKYKVGYRISFPKQAEEYEKIKADERNSLLETINFRIQDFNKKRVIDKCDIFLPTSKEMQDVFYTGVGIKSFALPPGVDPKKTREKQTIDDDKKYFIYVGTVDKVRNFSTVLKAFAALERKDWILKISTPNPAYTKKLMQDFPTISENVKFCRAKNMDGVMEQIALSDIGISLMPDIPLYNTSTPAKIMDYYSCSIPTLMTNNSKNSSIFSDNENAWFCSFSEQSIKAKLEEILETPKSKLEEMGKKGLDRLLDVRNYQKMAKGLFEALESL